MRRSPNTIRFIWEYCPTPDAKAQVDAAFDLLFGKAASQDQNLTENHEDCIMPHERQDSAIT